MDHCAKSLLLLTLLFALTPSLAPACAVANGEPLGGDSNVNSSGHRIERDLRRALAQTPISLGPISEKPDSKESEKVQVRAVNLILTGKTKEAIAMLVANERKFPGTYENAENLGTAYELAGDNQSALKWIKEGLRRNPNAHAGTEWVHVMILEAKAGQEDPNGAPKRLLFNLPFKFDAQTQIEAGGQMRSAGEVYKALLYQLKERLVFVKPPDSYVADLLYGLALIDANINSDQSAYDVFDLAGAYGFQDYELLTQSRSKFGYTAGHMTGRAHLNPIIVCGVLFLLGAAALNFVVSRRKT